ncbi:MAG: hypothetical protein JWM33_3608 [Caulobacteraceae bacterium]|nr:hypothetical protein [Caulobacteraceae bacterium]
MLEVAPDLQRLREREKIIVDGLHLQDAALGVELEEGDLVGMLPQFLGREKAAIRQASATVGGVNDGGDLRLQRAADFVEQAGEGRIAGGLGGASTTDGIKIGQVALRGGHAEGCARLPLEAHAFN